MFVNTLTGEITDDLQAVEPWTTCDEVPLDAVQEISPLRAALWEFYRNLPGGRTFQQFQDATRFAHGFNQVWCYALNLPNWKDGKPPPPQLRNLNPNTGGILA